MQYEQQKISSSSKNKAVTRQRFKPDLFFKIELSFFLLLILMPLTSSAWALENQFAGMGFGVGLSLTIDIGEHNRINEAVLDENGVVRVTSENNDVPRIMLESHYFFTPKGDDFGIGPFVALQPGTDEIIEAIGMGIMMGFKRRSSEDETSSWNIGLGAVVDPSVKILGDGIKENQALPSGETQVRFKETSQWGMLLVASFTF